MHKTFLSRIITAEKQCLPLSCYVCSLTNKDRRNPPKKGTIITYKFQEYSNSGTPRFPTYVGIRIDMTEPKDAEGVVTEGQDDE